MNNKIILLGADHNGVALKGHVKDLLKRSGFIVLDLGPYDDRKSVDYVDYANQVARIISSRDAPCGVLICGTEMRLNRGRLNSIESTTL
jgi:ribose 5-phosphate isomerase B